MHQMVGPIKKDLFMTFMIPICVKHMFLWMFVFAPFVVVLPLFKGCLKTNLGFLVQNFLYQVNVQSLKSHQVTGQIYQSQ